MVSIEEYETPEQLAAWVGLFAVATAMAGIRGMNFEFVPALKWRFGHAAALGAIALACVPMWRRFRGVG